MGMYTEFHFNVELKQNLPDEVVRILDCMTKGSQPPKELPKHELFTDPNSRWKFMLQGDSAYFPVIPCSKFEYERAYTDRVLSIRTNFKNYSDEIKKFIDWISSYIDGNELFLGYYRYEENDFPVLIFRTYEGEIKYSQLMNMSHTEHDINTRG